MVYLFGFTVEVDRTISSVVDRKSTGEIRELINGVQAFVVSFALWA
jgi:hypothetical protein